MLGAGVGREVGIYVGLGVGIGVGIAVGAQASPCRTPHDVDSHWVLANALARFRAPSTHQPRSWLKALAPANICNIVVSSSMCQSSSGRLNDEALWNILYIDVTPEVSQALISSSKDAAAVLQPEELQY